MNERERWTWRSVATPSPIPLLGALILALRVRFIRRECRALAGALSDKIGTDAPGCAFGATGIQVRIRP